MTLKIVEGLSAVEANHLRDRLTEFADTFTGARNRSEFGLALQDSAGNILGGILGDTVWDWLQIGTLWVTSELRGQGYGHQLLVRAEDLGRARKCRFARLSTWEFEAKDFYESHGYTVYGQIEDFPEGHTQYFMRKSL